jgi:hypothetical protein
MRIEPSPIPGWAWDLIEKVERGERRPGLVSEIEWRTRRGNRFDRLIKRAEDGDIKAAPETIERAIGQWRRDAANHTKSSSGTAWTFFGRITITAGWSEEDQKMVLLHELAHLLCPRRAHHSKVWQRKAARLYSKYGGQEIVNWALQSERSPAFKDFLRTRYGAI